MKNQSQRPPAQDFRGDRALKRFWAYATVDGLFNDDKGISFKINRIITGKSDSLRQLEPALVGKCPWFDNMPMPCRELSLADRGDGYMGISSEGDLLGHRLSEQMEIAILCSYDDHEFETATLGLSVEAWNFRHVHENFLREAGRKNKDEFNRRRLIEDLANGQRRQPVRLYWKGSMVTTKIMEEWARFFEYKGWPEGVEIHLNVKGTWTAVEGIPMLRKPKQGAITGNQERPDWRNPILDQLYLLVKDRDPLVEADLELPDESHIMSRKYPSNHRGPNSVADRSEIVGHLAKPGDEKIVALDTVLAKVGVEKTGPKGPQLPTRPERRRGEPASTRKQQLAQPVPRQTKPPKLNEVNTA